MKDNHRWNGNQDCYCNKQDVEEHGHCEPTNDCECCDSQSTIDSEVRDILLSKVHNCGGDNPRECMGVIREAAHTITNLIAQEANKGRIDELKKYYFDHPSHKNAKGTTDRIAQLQNKTNEEPQ